ncbi:acyltransferase family protein [Cystobacter fuscus]|nr:acyltransferase [Cystobacter fuscus]
MARGSLTSSRRMVSSSSAHQRFLHSRFFGGLDGLRCLSIVAVVLHHAASSHHGVFVRFNQGVSLFFAISGFLITTLLLRERDSRGDISLTGFYARRSLRIFPLYYAVLGLYTLLVVFLEKDVQARMDFLHNLPAFLTYTSNWFVSLEGRVIFYFAWSLATEEQFYLLWPPVMRYARAAGALAFMSGVLALSLLAPLAVRAGYIDTHVLWGRILTSFHPSISMGCLAALVAHSSRGFAWLYRVLGQAWSAPLALLLVAGAFFWDSTPKALFSLLFTALVVATCIRPDHVLMPVLGLSWVRYVGTVSYGVYLLHMLVFNLVRRAMPRPFTSLLESSLGSGMVVFVNFVLGLGVSVLLAGLSHRYFESRFLAWKEHFDWRTKPSPAEPVVSSSNSPA